MATDYQAGFSLLELAVVLFVLSLLAAGVLTPLKAQRENQQIRSTKISLERLSKVILGYTLSQGHLPCPDSNGDGWQNRLGNSRCQNSSGTLPWRDLSVAATDAWHQPIRFAVSLDYADQIEGAAGCATVSTGISFSLCSEASLRISRNLDGSDQLAQQVPFILFSQGQPRGFNSTLETENLDGDLNFIKRDHTLVAGTEFNDLLIWVPDSLLKYIMINAQRLP
ncbi:MAG: prepilin-type N-terminal cleavage/methylation domain-containing protein [Gammaproteobacteria bacterium]|nr:prepilin-type N-terminal cleavage/methylation domain-containing protein [Gammaproteobacteria bacterium]